MYLLEGTHQLQIQEAARSSVVRHNIFILLFAPYVWYHFLISSTREVQLFCHLSIWFLFPHQQFYVSHSEVDVFILQTLYVSDITIFQIFIELQIIELQRHDLVHKEIKPHIQMHTPIYARLNRCKLHSEAMNIVHSLQKIGDIIDKNKSCLYNSII